VNKATSQQPLATREQQHRTEARHGLLPSGLWRVASGSRRAFTLAELLLVVVIIGVLAGMAALRLSGRSQDARIARAQADLKGEIAAAIDLFEQDTGRLPTNDEGLKALMSGEGIDGWKGPYLKAPPIDPWGTEYSYQTDGPDATTYHVLSAGPDKKLQTADDIK